MLSTWPSEVVRAVPLCWNGDSNAHAEGRWLIIEYCLRMLKDGIAVGTSGNISVRVGENIAITPSGVDYEALVPEGICVISLNGKHVDGPDNPSTEVPMHTVVYENTDAPAVVHTHLVYATVLGTLVDEMPLIHCMLALRK